MPKVSINGKQVQLVSSNLIEILKDEKNKTFIVAFINGELRDINSNVENEDRIFTYSFDDRIGKQVFWHTSAHILAQAVKRLWPQSIPTIGPSTEDGFFYDFDNLSISDEDIPKIEKEMLKISSENFLTERIEIQSKKEALELFKDNQYKVEIINSLSEDSKITAYKQGEFLDLCKGPHLPSTGIVKAIKINNISGAYWKGDKNNKMLCRISATSFPSQKELRTYIENRNEAKKRDHKVLGPEMGIFMLLQHAPGFPFILPNGNFIWDKLIDHIKACQKDLGYLFVKTPMIMDRCLWEKSGHWENYKSNMYQTSIESKPFAIKPMNCPGAALVFGSTTRSYKHLPFRIFEVGHVHRYEFSGALSGLMRVRGFHQDDSHTYLEMDQVESEVVLILDLIKKVYSPFGLEYKIELSTRPENGFIGDEKRWDEATKALEKALVSSGNTFKINPGDGAFYGPKIDIHVQDSLKRSWQCATVQLDLFQAEKFDLEYVGKDNIRHKPVVIHRAIYGSIERFVGILIEHFGGKFPLWIHPNPITVLPVSQTNEAFAKKVFNQIKTSGINVSVDISENTLQKRIKMAASSKCLYTIIVGAEEEEKNCISVRVCNKVIKNISICDFINNITKEVEEKLISSAYVTKEG